MHRGKKITQMCINSIDTSSSKNEQKTTPFADKTLKRNQEPSSVSSNRNIDLTLNKNTNTANPAELYSTKYFENDYLWKRPYSFTTPLFRKFNEYETSDPHLIDMAITKFSQENLDNFKEQDLDLLCHETLEDDDISEISLNSVENSMPLPMKPPESVLAEIPCNSVKQVPSTDDESSVKDYDSDDSVKDKDYVPEDDSSGSEESDKESVVYSMPPTVKPPESDEKCDVEKKHQIRVQAEVYACDSDTRQVPSLNFSVQKEGQTVLSLKLLCLGVINSNKYQILNKNETVTIETNNKNGDIEYDGEVITVIVIQDECEANITETNTSKDKEPEELIQENRAGEEIFEVNQEHEQARHDDCYEKDLKLYTKSGQLRKRKIYETSLTERLQEKRTKYREQFLVKGGCKCANKCMEKFSKEERETLNENYWQMSWKTRRIFIRQSCYVIIPKRTLTSSPKRHPKRKFFFKNVYENKVDVCKPFFLSTLGYKPTNDTVLYNALKVKDCEEIQDSRGKHKKTILFDRDNITRHIESFHPTISHYRREHAPLRRYLPSDVNVKMMHEHFLEKNPNQQMSYDLYRKHLKSMNISFARLGNEECEICEAHRIHCESESHDKENLPTDCQVCNDYLNHKMRAKKARMLYSKHKENKNESHLYFSTDLEKIIMLPRLDTFKEVIFCQRLVAYNQTFAPLGKSNDEKPLAVLWHEAIAGRKQNDIISAFKAFFNKYRDIKYFDLWLDNCSAQNKNWLLYFFLVHLINSDEISANKITLNYFEKGHTYMSCDHFHHQVELSMKKSGKLYDFQDFVDCVEKANSGKVAVKEMQLADFIDISDYTSNRRIQTSTPRVYMKNIVQVRFERKSYNMFYKSDFDSDYIEVCFLKDTYLKPKNGSVPEVLTPRENARGISETRKLNILTKLAKLMLPHKLTFWKRIPTNNINNEETD